jgi:hypothetical protein
MIGFADTSDRDRVRDVLDLAGAAPIAIRLRHAAPDLALTIQAA